MIFVKAAVAGALLGGSAAFVMTLVTYYGLKVLL